jgi:hypothetical protein
MRALAGILACIVVLAAVSFFATGTLGDRELMTPPPESAAEGFVRSVSLRRWEPAQEFVSEDAAIPLVALHQQIGRAADVDAETVEQDERRALVRVQTESAAARHLLYVRMEWDEEWKVAEATVSY